MVPRNRSEYQWIDAARTIPNAIRLDLVHDGFGWLGLELTENRL